jgi:hypothetical protein
MLMCNSKTASALLSLPEVPDDSLVLSPSKHRIKYQEHDGVVGKTPKPFRE